MSGFDDALKELIKQGKTRGHVTFNEVARLVPHSGGTGDELDRLLSALEQHGIEVIHGEGDGDPPRRC